MLLKGTNVGDMAPPEPGLHDRDKISLAQVCLNRFAQPGGFVHSNGKRLYMTQIIKKSR